MSWHDVLMTEDEQHWTVRRFSQSNPAGRGEGYVPALLRRVADSIESLGDVRVNDITFHAESTAGEEDLTMTVYYHPAPRPKGSSMDGTADYEPLCHAPVADHTTVAWVVIGHWDNGSRQEWCVEAWDSVGDRGRDDENFASLAEAEAYARATFGVTGGDWSDGPGASRSSDWR